MRHCTQRRYLYDVEISLLCCSHEHRVTRTVSHKQRLTQPDTRRDVTRSACFDSQQAIYIQCPLCAQLSKFHGKSCLPRLSRYLTKDPLRLRILDSDVIPTR